MATQADANRPSPAPFTTEQRQRLEALQFAKRVVGTGSYEQDRMMTPDERLTWTRDLADYIVTGAF